MSGRQSFTRLVPLSSFRQANISTPLVARQVLRSSRRGYTSSAPKSSSSKLYLGIGAAALAGAGGYYFSNSGQAIKLEAKPSSFAPTKDDYQNVYNEIARLLEEKDEYDDGSYGPVVLRLAWHCSGTYDKQTGTGGSNGATMRFAPESDHGANAGLKAARDFLDPVKEKFPWITYSDLWTLAGVCAVQEMQGPTVPWRPGRKDRDVAFCTPDGRLPDGAKEQNHLRAIFSRMGFNDQEIVALSGAHALGRCHTDRSGFEGPWTFSPTVFSNDFYTLLVNEKWNYREWNGPKQFQDSTSKSLMMLPSDMALVDDKIFRKHVEVYAKDVDRFYTDFSAALTKLLELGVPFETEERMKFTPTV